jgi:hypothetical protein
MAGLDTLVGTFGPFLIPVVVFAVGAVGYGVLFALNRVRGTDAVSKWESTDERRERHER